MEQELSTTDDGCLSTSGPLPAIIEWDAGRPDSLVVYPIGGSAEGDDQIRRILKQAFTKLQASKVAPHLIETFNRELHYEL